MKEFIEFVTLIFNNWTTIVNAVLAIFSALFVISEVLAQIPSIKANSVFQLVQGWIKSILKK